MPKSKIDPLLWEGVILGAPRTKKNSMRVVHPIYRGRRITKLIPGAPYTRWVKTSELAARPHCPIPIKADIWVKAIVYKDRKYKSDLAGYIQAVGDWLELCVTCREERKHCKCPMMVSIIEDDFQIKSWDGSRISLDRRQPRIEVTISAFTEQVTPAKKDWEEVMA